MFVGKKMYRRFAIFQFIETLQILSIFNHVCTFKSWRSTANENTINDLSNRVRFSL